MFSNSRVGFKLPILLFSVLLQWSLVLPPSLPAFDDDSRDDTKPLSLLKTICFNGHRIIDTERSKSSCQGDHAFISIRNTGLFKHENRLAHKPILDFKISRGGRVYYRTEIGPYLYDEKGQLNSGQGAVVIYLVATSGDVVYLNSSGEIFKNGFTLKQGAANVVLKHSEIILDGRRSRRVQNPVVSRGGKAIYQNDSGYLYVDGRRLNHKVTDVRSFRVNSTGDVYYSDGQNRLYRNSKKLYDGKFTLLNFQLSPLGQVAYLVNKSSKNLFLEGRAWAAGSRQIVKFHFNNAGDIFYRDDMDRLWKNGKAISR